MLVQALILGALASNARAALLPESLGVAFTAAALATVTGDLTAPLATADSIPIVKVDVTTQQASTKASGTAKPDTSGTIVVELERSGRPGILPFPLPNLPATQKFSLLSSVTGPVATSTFASGPSTTTINNIFNKITVNQATVDITLPLKSPEAIKQIRGAKMMKRAATDCFGAMPTSSLPGGIPSRGDHPVSRKGITDSGPVSTNKFYANFFLGNQNQGVWTHPFSLTWSKGGGPVKSWGMSISHVDANQRAYGPTHPEIPGSPVQYVINPIGIQSIILSATELGSSTVLTTKSLKATSVFAILQAQAGSGSSITMPCVQGMGFVTAIYKTLTPLIQTGVFFQQLVGPAQPSSGTFRYSVRLADGKTWLIYAISNDYSDPMLKLVSNSQIKGRTGWTGTIQITKLPASNQLTAIDQASGIYTTTTSISASVDGNAGTYQFRRSSVRISRNTAAQLLMYALPHHVSSFDSTTRANIISGLTLQTTTKGVATAVRGTSWTMTEGSLPTDMGFAPWTPSTRSRTGLSSTARTLIDQVATSEIAQDMQSQTYLNSMYFSGKALSKFAMIVYTLKDLVNQPSKAASGLARLKTEFGKFVANKQPAPLAYDSKWGGVVSSAGFTGDPNQDFGNTRYNDHHFHYAYFIHAAAIIAYMDPSWLQNNALWVNTLIRDANNPSNNDPQFPFSRSFDWYHGHSWAQGLFESADGKDEESSSEDALFAYALKMWGKASNQPSMEARGNLMLAVLSRSLNSYFLLSNTNANQPSNFIANKVTGILFENKMDHTTYFGTNPEYIQGIHMLPLSPFSAYTRSTSFITQEWSSYFSDSSNTPASKVSGGWRGILYGNYACANPPAAWKFFTQTNFDQSWLDGGASRAWYLAYTAAIGGF